MCCRSGRTDRRARGRGGHSRLGTPSGSRGPSSRGPRGLASLAQRSRSAGPTTSPRCRGRGCAPGAPNDRLSRGSSSAGLIQALSRRPAASCTRTPREGLVPPPLSQWPYPHHRIATLPRPPFVFLQVTAVFWMRHEKTTRPRRLEQRSAKLRDTLRQRQVWTVPLRARPTSERRSVRAERGPGPR